MNDLKLNNTLVYKEIPPSLLNDVFKQVHFGIVFLDKNHKSHNIPGKFLAYLQAGLPVFASVNPLNDLHYIIKKENVGFSTDSDDLLVNQKGINYMIKNFPNKKVAEDRAKKLFQTKFSTEVAAKKIHSFFFH